MVGGHAGDVLEDGEGLKHRFHLFNFQAQPAVSLVHAGVLGVVLKVVEHACKRGALVVGAVFVGHEGGDEFPALQHEFFHAEQLGHPPQADRSKQFLGLLRKRPKPVFEAVTEALKFPGVVQVVELAVQRNPLRNVAHVVVGDEQAEVGFQHSLFDVLAGLGLLVLHEVFELFFLQFLHRLGQDALVHVEAQIVDEPALFRAEEVSRAADVEVAHGDLHAGAEVRELLEGLESFARFRREGAQGRRHEVTEGLSVGAPDPSPQLVQVAEPKLVRLVDQHRVRVRDVDPAFDDGGCHQHVKRAVDEARHHVFEVLAFHLAVADADARVGNEALNHARHFLDVADAVVHEVSLPAPAELVGDGVPDDFFVEARDDRVDGVPVGRWGADDAQVARAHQGELQRPWNRRRGEGQGVDVGLERLEFVLDAHPKLLLLVNHQQPQILEFHSLSDQRVGADEDVHLALLHFLERLGQRLARLEAVDVLHGDEVAQSPAEALVVLHRQDGRGHEHGHLFAVAGRPERRPNRDFRLPKADVPAHEAVHGRGLEHVFAHGLGGRVLIGGVFVHEARL